MDPKAESVLDGPHLEARREGAPAQRLALAEGKAVVLGRGADADLRLATEPFLGRRHVQLALAGRQLRVERLAGSSNPIFVAGEAKDSFALEPGESFVIGSTRFRFQTSGGSGVSIDESDGAPELRHTLEEKDLYEMDGATRQLRLRDLLELPEVLRSTNDPTALYLHAAGLLRLATGAGWACVLDASGAVLAQDAADDATRPTVSRTLLSKAAAEAPKPTVWRWSGAGDAGATVVDGVRWAVCAAAQVAEGKTVCFYAAGSDRREQLGDRALDDRARFAGLIADMVGRTVANDRLRTIEKRLERFFSAPVAAKILEAGGEEGLAPRLAVGTVLFFDLRGFSRKTEGSNAELLSYMGELRSVMTRMTAIVLEEQGAVLQYIGDAIMASWNLPLPDERHVDRACRAALRMAEALAGMSGGWRCGIGLHTGEVVAGAIGSDQIFSYSVLGAVVNQASRVEGITKQIEAPILVTREVTQRLSPETAKLRRLGRFRPAGMGATLELFELRGPGADAGGDARFAQALSAFEKGDWETAYQEFDELPSSDRPARFLKALCEQHRRRPPKSWEGVIELESK